MTQQPGAVKGIDARRLEPWFEQHVVGAKSPLCFELITGGHSNLTFSVRDAAGHHYVLRRPPTGAVIATAHDMAREHRILAALAGSEVPVPPVLALCADPTVNDAPFYVMSFVEGVVLVDQHVTAKHLGAAERRLLGEEVIEVLAALHRIDPDAVGLGDLGRREDYLERQLRRWQGQWEKTKTRELPVMDEVYADLLARRPAQVGATLVHGDYRLGNMLIAAGGRIAAVLDWELCTLGDPLADVGYVLNNWAQPGETGPGGRGAAISPTLAGGFPDRPEFLERYAKRSGRDVSHIDYYRAFQYWRLAAIVEGVLSRYLKGVMGDRPDTRVFGEQVELMAQTALDLLKALPR